MTDLYEVSAKWMKACGKGDAAKVFTVLRTETFNNGLTAVTLNDGGYEWVVIAEWRGRFVDVSESSSIEISEPAHADIAADNGTAQNAVKCCDKLALAAETFGKASSEPFNRAFNVACQHIASRLFPLGFDVSDTDAPQTYEALCDRMNSGARMLVDSNNSEDTIFACAESNYAFRAWHDWCHWRGGHDFTLEGEYRVARMQKEHLLTIYGPGKQYDDFCRLIDEEVIAQASYKAVTGEFPKNQRAFAADFLAIANSYPACHT